MTNTQSPYLITISLTRIIYIFIQIIHIKSAVETIGIVFYKTTFMPTNPESQL